LPALAAASLLSLGLSASPAAAQQASPAGTVPLSELCHVYAIEGAEGEPSELRANCRGQGLMLGRATEFEAVVNEGLKATLVDIRLGSARRVLLLSIQPDGSPLVEDMSGQIALAAGRGPMSEIDGVDLDLREFARSSEIGVRGRPEDTGSGKADRINFGQQIALERSRRGGNGAQN
jgi:hypothetical protein